MHSSAKMVFEVLPQPGRKWAESCLLPELPKAAKKSAKMSIFGNFGWKNLSEFEWENIVGVRLGWQFGEKTQNYPNF